jgi:ankyrin repeat protein
MLLMQLTNNIWLPNEKRAEMTAASASLPTKMPTKRSSSLEGPHRNGFTLLMRAASHADDDAVANCIADGVDLFEKDAKVQVESLSFSKSIFLFCELHRAMLELLIKKCL